VYSYSVLFWLIPYRRKFQSKFPLVGRRFLRAHLKPFLTIHDPGVDLPGPSADGPVPTFFHRAGASILSLGVSRTRPPFPMLFYLATAPCTPYLFATACPSPLVTQSKEPFDVLSRPQVPEKSSLSFFPLPFRIKLGTQSSPPKTSRYRGKTGTRKMLVHMVRGWSGASTTPFIARLWSSFPDR